MHMISLGPVFLYVFVCTWIRKITGGKSLVHFWYSIYVHIFIFQMVTLVFNLKSAQLLPSMFVPISNMTSQKMPSIKYGSTKFGCMSPILILNYHYFWTTSFTYFFKYWNQLQNQIIKSRFPWDEFGNGLSLSSFLLVFSPNFPM